MWRSGRSQPTVREKHWVAAPIALRTAKRSTALRIRPTPDFALYTLLRRQSPRLPQPRRNSNALRERPASAHEPQPSRLALAANPAPIYARCMTKPFSPTSRTKVQRLPDRGKYDRETVYRILDEGFVCHVGFVVDGQPFVIPTNYARVDDTLYVHGSAASRMLRTLAGGVQVCVTVTLVDGLVLARSAFHHSMNYRSVVILGTAHAVEDREEKILALSSFTNHVVPGRWDAVRAVRDSEIKATSVLKLLLQEVSAKIR